MGFITSARTIRMHPLLTSLSPRVRVGPCALRLVISDSRLAVMEGPDLVDGRTMAWVAAGGEFLERSLEAWHAALAESEPALPPGTDPPLDARQLEVARLVCLGSTDAAIARQLQISRRTVARDVSAILDVTEARSRSEAILNMLGRGHHSRS